MRATMSPLETFGAKQFLLYYNRKRKQFMSLIYLIYFLLLFDTHKAAQNKIWYNKNTNTVS